MTTKRILFAVLCVLLLLVVILFGIVLGKIGTLFKGFQVSNPPGTTQGPSTSTPADPTGNPTDPSTNPSQPVLPTPPPDHEHDYVYSDTLSATCEGYGWNVFVCSICGHTDMPLDQRIDPLGHSFVPGQLVDPTCEEAGYTEYTCARCQTVEHRDEVEALGHIYDEGTEMPATCGEDAHTAYHCTREGCEEVKKDNIQEGTATGEHTFGQWIPNEDGTLLVRTCEVCHFEETKPNDGTDIPAEPLSITSNTKETLTDGAGNTYTRHTITIGTTAEPAIYTLTVTDYSNNETLSITYEPDRGPSLSYMTADGGIKLYNLAKDSNLDITIDADGNLVL